MKGDFASKPRKASRMLAIITIVAHIAYAYTITIAYNTNILQALKHCLMVYCIHGMAIRTYKLGAEATLHLTLPVPMGLVPPCPEHVGGHCIITSSHCINILGTRNSKRCVEHTS